LYDLFRFIKVLVILLLLLLTSNLENLAVFFCYFLLNIYNDFYWLMFTEIFLLHFWLIYYYYFNYFEEGIHLFSLDNVKVHFNLPMLSILACHKENTNIFREPK
jgi:hypothetical protein